jgi:hypothetical protein
MPPQKMHTRVKAEHWASNSGQSLAPHPAGMLDRSRGSSAAMPPDCVRQNQRHPAGVPDFVSYCVSMENPNSSRRDARPRPGVERSDTPGIALQSGRNLSRVQVLQYEAGLSAYSLIGNLVDIERGRGPLRLSSVHQHPLYPRHPRPESLCIIVHKMHNENRQRMATSDCLAVTCVGNCPRDFLVHYACIGGGRRLRTMSVSRLLIVNAPL